MKINAKCGVPTEVTKRFETEIFAQWGEDATDAHIYTATPAAQTVAGAVVYVCRFSSQGTRRKLRINHHQVSGELEVVTPQSLNH